ncbi:MAG: acyl-CoA dehydrogenase family protein [Symplocastrum torsivum CPER-KK1]|jgi:alkylation response protein AidB-like acyl-CoA dehydrogenase|uniref:Dibenzothiophene monooxygenase n=1 Tax=Symplocastrum torsivum CPER-KK1 TaxID=450513 RepID=A0A951UBV9_9CYAN|nr:acyl-CoA dehydrogenase family protein [Symplocastrum torsivum CPER-KK1]
MQLVIKESTDYKAIATALASEFAETAVERDAKGGTPQYERDKLRESGLLNLIIPKEFGGIGESWTTILKIVRDFAKVDSSIAHVFSYHHLGVVAPHVFGNSEQKERYYTQTVKNNWFWCNALNPLDRRVILTPDGNKFRLNGTKSFCSGSIDSDVLPVTAVQEGVSGLIVVVVPTQRAGVVVNDDWDNMGQRQTDSGSVTFNNVLIEKDEILLPSSDGNTFKTIRSCLTQITFTNIYLGVAQGAFEAAKEYTRTQTRPWLTSGVDSATQDPYILQHYGDMWVHLQGATALADQAGELLQAAWEKNLSLTAEQRGECAIAIATAKVAATRVGLDIANRMFEVMGSRATASKYGFDRYWRNLRTFTLHDPIDYKVRAVGNWALNNQLPTPDFYS